MSTSGKGVYLINSGWASGALVFYEKAVGRTATGDVFTLSTTAVKVGGTSQDVDFQWYGTGSISAILDAGDSSLTLVGVNLATNAPVVITDATESTSTTTGALIVSGGIANAKDTYLGDDVFLTSAAKIDWAAGNALLTHSTGLLTFSASNVAFGVDATGVDVTFYGDTASAQVLWDMSDDALEFTGVAKCKFGVSGTELVYTAGTPIFTLYATAAGSGSTNCEPFLVTSIVTGTSPVGGRAKFVTTCNVTAGGWINALKSHMQFGSSGKVTGLASSFVAEMDLPNANLGSGGAYYPLEVELNPGASTVSAGSPTGNQLGFIYMSVNTNLADFNTNGFLFRVVGPTSEDGGVFYSGAAPATLAASFRIIVGTTAYYLPLYSAQHA